jgi:WD40 repeat protein
MPVLFYYYRGLKRMENPEKMAGLKDFLTNGCNQDASKKTRLAELYNSYEDFTRVTETTSYSRSTFKEHINHLFKIKKDPDTKNLIVSGIKPKNEQQKEFKINQKEVTAAAIEEANTEMIMEEEEQKVEPENIKEESFNKEEEKAVEVEIKEIERTIIDEVKDLHPITDLDVSLKDLKSQRQLIDKKISMLYKINDLKDTINKLVSLSTSTVNSIKNVGEADDMTNKLNNAIKIINSIKI